MIPEDYASLQFLAENTDDVICRAGLNRVVRYASPSSFHILGWAPAEMIGRQLDTFFVSEGTFADAVDEQETSSMPVRIRRKNGTVAWLAIKSRLICDSTSGQPKETLFVMHDITERKALEEKLSLLAAKDEVTGLCTLRAFEEALEREWSRTVRENSHISLLLIDFHHFKQFHSRRPHVEGDGCLEKAAGLVIAAARGTDIAAHYGSEDIAVILPATGRSGAAKVAAKVRAAVRDLRPPRGAVTKGEAAPGAMSIGIATAFARPGSTVDMPKILVLAANVALHNAKNEGADSRPRPLNYGLLGWGSV
jgi:diguanylate cyclase (GGDEF)-like protein/PAS domain S-box-containing protein